MTDATSLTPAQAIKTYGSKEKRGILADRYGVSKMTISQIKRGRTHRPITGAPKPPPVKPRLRIETVMAIYNSVETRQALSARYGCVDKTIADIQLGRTHVDAIRDYMRFQRREQKQKRRVG